MAKVKIIKYIFHSCLLFCKPCCAQGIKYSFCLIIPAIFRNEQQGTGIDTPLSSFEPERFNLAYFPRYNINWNGHGLTAGVFYKKGVESMKMHTLCFNVMYNR